MITIARSGTEYRLETSVEIDRPQHEVFEFFCNAENLQLLTPTFLDFSILTPLPILMTQGTRIDYQIRIHGIPLRWKTLISEWDPPHRFIDEQIRGPYLLWQHCHLFTPTSGGTRMTDIVRYRPIGGWLTNRLFVEKDLYKIFQFRRETLLAHFAQPTSPGSLSTYCND